MTQSVNLTQTKKKARNISQPASKLSNITTPKPKQKNSKKNIDQLVTSPNAVIEAYSGGDPSRMTIRSSNNVSPKNSIVLSENKGLWDQEKEYKWNRSNGIENIRHSYSKQAPKKDFLKIQVEDIESVPVAVTPLIATRNYREASEQHNPDTNIQLKTKGENQCNIDMLSSTFTSPLQRRNLRSKQIKENGAQSIPFFIHENNLNASAERIYGQEKSKTEKERQMKYRTFNSSVKFAKSDQKYLSRSQNEDQMVVVLQPAKQQRSYFYHQKDHNSQSNASKTSESDNSITSDLYNFQTRSNKIKMQSSTNGDTIGSNNANPSRRRGKPPIQQSSTINAQSKVKQKDSQCTNRSSKSKNHQRLQTQWVTTVSTKPNLVVSGQKQISATTSMHTIDPCQNFTEEGAEEQTQITRQEMMRDRAYLLKQMQNTSSSVNQSRLTYLPSPSGNAHGHTISQSSTNHNASSLKSIPRQMSQTLAQVAHQQSSIDQNNQQRKGSRPRHGDIGHNPANKFEGKKHKREHSKNTQRQQQQLESILVGKKATVQVIPMVETSRRSRMKQNHICSEATPVNEAGLVVTGVQDRTLMNCESGRQTQQIASIYNSDTTENKKRQNIRPNSAIMLYEKRQTSLQGNNSNSQINERTPTQISLNMPDHQSQALQINGSMTQKSQNLANNHKKHISIIQDPAATALIEEQKQEVHYGDQLPVGRNKLEEQKGILQTVEAGYNNLLPTSQTATIFAPNQHQFHQNTNQSLIHQDDLQLPTTSQIQHQLKGTTDEKEDSETQSPAKPHHLDQMILSQQQQQQQNKQSSSNQHLSSAVSRTGVEMANFPKGRVIAPRPQHQQSTDDNNYLVLDNQNRVILVNSTGVHPNTSAAALLQPQSAQLSVRASYKSKSNARSPPDVASNSAGHHQAQPQQSYGYQRVNSMGVAHGSQQKIIDQLAGGSVSGPSTSKRKTLGKAAQSLKENEVLHWQDAPAASHGQDAILRDLNSLHDANTRNDYHQCIPSGASSGSAAPVGCGTTTTLKGNRNSNQNMKTSGQGPQASTAAAGVSRPGQPPAGSFSTTTSTYHSLASGPQPAPSTTQNVHKNVVYQLDQNFNYVVSQVATNQANQTHPPQHITPIINSNQQSSVVRPPQQQQMLQPGQRPQPGGAVGAGQQLQQYYSNQSQILRDFHQQQLQLQLQSQQHAVAQQHQAKLQAQHQYGGGANHTSSQQSMKANSNRPRPRSSAPATHIKKRVQNAAQSRDVVSRVQIQPGELVHAQSMGPVAQDDIAVTRQFLNENLMQTTGHIIVTNVNGTHQLNEIQMPMIINQATGSVTAIQQPQIKPNGQGAAAQNTLCITGLMHPDLFLQQVQQQQQQQQQLQLQLQQTHHNPQNAGQSSNKRRDGNLSQQASNTSQNGFFDKRKNRDHRDSKVTAANTGQPISNQKAGAQQHLANGQGQVIQSQATIAQKGGPTNVAISNPQYYLIQRENYQSNTSGSHRPLTGNQGSNQFHKTHGSISMKSNTQIANSNQPIVSNLVTNESDSESVNNRLSNNENAKGGVIMGSCGINKRSSVQANSQPITEPRMSESQGGNGFVQQQKLQSVRSGQILNYNNSIGSDHEQAQPSSKDLVPSKQLSNSEKVKILNQSASPSTKISIRGRKGVSTIMGTGASTGTSAGLGLQMLPSTPKTYKRTRRVLFARRMNLMDRPMLIVTFQGVLGDFMKKPNPGLKEHFIIPSPIQPPPPTGKEKKQPVQREEEAVNLRAGALEGLRYLSQLFQLVIFSRETIEDSWFESKGGQVAESELQTKAILNLIQQNPDIKLDGFYASVLSAKNQSMTDDYSQIFIDFGLNSEQKVKEKVLFVNSISSEYICNQRLPATGNISPKGKKPNPAQLGISYARGLTDIDNQGYFMFDTACQPAEPLVKGLPISLDMKQHQQRTMQGARSSSIIAEQQQKAAAEDSNFTAATQGLSPQTGEPSVTTRQMPSTLLVPNLRTQNAKTQTNFSHIIKTIMMLAFLGQKKNSGKPLLKDPSLIDYNDQLGEIESDFGAIKEKQIKLTSKKLHITPQLNRAATDIAAATIVGAAGISAQHLSSSQKNSVPRRTRQIGGGNSGSSAMNQREAESPASDLSGHNGSQSRVLKHANTTKQNLNLKMQGQTTTSSRTAATTHMGHENTNSSGHSHQQQQPQNNGSNSNERHGGGAHQARSQSINSDNGLYQQYLDPNMATSQQLFQNDSSSNMGHQTEHSPKDGPEMRDVCVDLTDGAFFASLSWSAGVDYLNSKPANLQKKFLGMQGACSDVVWRFYRKQAQERIKLRQIYETKMSQAEQLVNKTLSNDTIVSNQQKNIDQIFEILRSRDLVGNPFGFTMGRNYRFFANLKVQTRRKLSSELQQWKASKEAAAATQKKPKHPSSAAPSQKQAAAALSESKEQQQVSGAAAAQEGDKEHSEASRFSSIIQSQQVWQQQQHEALEELLERNKLINRFVVVGLDAPAMK